MNSATTVDFNRLLTLDQAAENLAVSRRTLERLIAAGDFPQPLKVGRASRVESQDIEAYRERLRRQRVSLAGGAS